MLKSDISLALAAGKSVRQIAAELAENFMADPKLLKADLQGQAPLGRKAFCEFMGIGESTLTGWLQAERIPQTAAVAYMLLLISQVLQEKCGALEGKESEPRVIALGGRYAVVRFDTSERGQGLGQVIASDIPDLVSARRIAFSQSKRMTRLIDRHFELIDDQIELTDQAGNNPAWLRSERTSLQQLITHFALGAEEQKPELQGLNFQAEDLSKLEEVHMRQHQYCAHASERLRQRGRCDQDVDLILRYGTPVKGDGVMLLEDDVTRTILDLKALSERLQRLANWKVVLAGNEIVTIYRARRHHQKRLLKS